MGIWASPAVMMSVLCYKPPVGEFVALIALIVINEIIVYMEKMSQIWWVFELAFLLGFCGESIAT
jgi:hypothetical protein